MNTRNKYKLKPTTRIHEFVVMNLCLCTGSEELLLLRQGRRTSWSNLGKRASEKGEEGDDK